MRNESRQAEGPAGPGSRRPYEKPTIEFIELHGDQVLSNSCKTAESSGQGAAPCASDGCYDNQTS